MSKQRKSYSPPRMWVDSVELESPICSGSVEFTGRQGGVYIEGQQIVDPAGNDFSADAWDTSGGTSTASDWQ